MGHLLQLDDAITSSYDDAKKLLEIMSSAVYNRDKKTEFYTKYDCNNQIVFGTDFNDGSFFLQNESNGVVKREDVGSIDDVDFRLLFNLLCDLYDRDKFPRGVYSGNILFYTEDLKSVDGDRYYFKPNTIRYEITRESSVYNYFSGGYAGVSVEARLDSKDPIDHHLFEQHCGIVWINPKLDLATMSSSVLELLLFNTGVRDITALVESVTDKTVFARHATTLADFYSYCAKIGEASPSALMYVKYLMSIKRQDLVPDCYGEDLAKLIMLRYNVATLKLFMLACLDQRADVVPFVKDERVFHHGFVIKNTELGDVLIANQHENAFNRILDKFYKKDKTKNGS